MVILDFAHVGVKYSINIISIFSGSRFRSSVQNSNQKQKTFSTVQPPAEAGSDYGPQDCIPQLLFC